MASDQATSGEPPALPAAHPIFEERSYLRITPTEAGVDSTQLTHAFEKLHGLPRQTEDSGGLFSSADETIPTIELLLCSTPTPDDAALGYYLGCSDPDQLQTIERVIRGALPDEYEFDTVRFSFADVFDVPQQGTTEQTLANRTLTTVDLTADAERRDDWQLPLTRFDEFAGEQHHRCPLNDILEVAIDAPAPVCYQVLMQPRPDWTAERDTRKRRLLNRRDTPGQRFFDTFVDPMIPDPEDGTTIEEADDVDEHRDPHLATRLEGLETATPQFSFDVTVRLATLAPTDDTTAQPFEPLTTAFTELENSYYSLELTPTEPDSDAAWATFEELLAADLPTDRSLTQRTLDRLPLTANRSPSAVVDAASLGTLTVLDGATLSTESQRALATPTDERTVLPPPPAERLEQYQTDGLTLGKPYTDDDHPHEQPIALPPDLQRLHTAWFGKTGSGKSTALLTAMLDNHEATEGASILIDPKGDGLPEEYMRAHYARHGSLADVYHFDCSETLPALSFFDIRDQLEAGIDRASAVEDVTDHYIDLLRSLMGRDRFDRAVRSPDIIRYLVKAGFDPVHGDDAYAHSDLQDAAARMAETRDAPPVSDPDLESLLGGVAANSKRSFDELMQGVANRIEKVPVNHRLGQLFDHVPGEDDPEFDLLDVLDDDCVVILDVGGLRPQTQRALTLVLLSALWSALKRRDRLADDATQHPLVNLYVEEAASIAVSDTLTDLLAQARGFDCAVTLATQFPAQVREDAPRLYAEVLNNVSTIVTGNVAMDRDLERRLATADMSPSEVGARLRALSRGEWVVTLPTGFGDEEPRPFRVASAPLPAGHPESDDPGSTRDEELLDAAIVRASARTRDAWGIDATRGRWAESTDGSPDDAEETDDDTDEDTPDEQNGVRVDSALPYTNRFPDPVRYNEASHALACRSCDTRYDPTIDGMRRAIRCCHSLADVDRDDVPIHEIPLKLSPEERADRDCSPAQLRFLQAVYAAHQQRYGPLEYDITRDSMIRLEEYTGIDKPQIDDLVDDGLLRVDCDRPHRLYTVSPSGRDVILEGHREGIGFGHDAGDLDESSQHVLAVELGRRYIEQAFVDDPESAAVEAVPYYELDDGRRLDAAGIDADGDVVVVVEAERANHDLSTGVPSDYDAMASCDPEAAVWVVMNRMDGHKVLDALNEPGDGDPRVEKSYSESTPTYQFTIDDPGFTAMYTVAYLQNSLLE